MAGSRKAMLYTDDLGKTHVVQVDESNGEAFGFDDYANNSSTGASNPYDVFDLGQVTQMRYVNWRAEDGTLSRRFWCGKPTTPIFLNGGDHDVMVLAGGQAVTKNGRFTSAVGEKRVLGVGTSDTGLNEGDVT